MGFHQITVKVNGSQELVNVPSNMTLMMNVCGKAFPLPVPKMAALQENAELVLYS